jgi:hypothetical protein
MVCAVIGKKSGNGGFARSGWAPKHQTAQGARLQHTAQHAFFTKQMILPHNLTEVLGTHTIGQWATVVGSHIC